MTKHQLLVDWLFFLPSEIYHKVTVQKHRVDIRKANVQRKKPTFKAYNTTATKHLLSQGFYSRASMAASHEHQHHHSNGALIIDLLRYKEKQEILQAQLTSAQRQLDFFLASSHKPTIKIVGKQGSLDWEEDSDSDYDQSDSLELRSREPVEFGNDFTDLSVKVAHKQQTLLHHKSDCCPVSPPPVVSSNLLRNLISENLKLRERLRKLESLHRKSETEEFLKNELHSQL